MFTVPLTRAMLTALCVLYTDITGKPLTHLSVFTGGYLAFQAMHPSLCENKPPLVIYL